MPLQRGMPTLGARPVLSRPSWRKTEVMLHLRRTGRASTGVPTGRPSF